MGVCIGVNPKLLLTQNIASRSGKIDIKTVQIFIFCLYIYNLLPQVFVVPTGIEGFENAIANHIDSFNQNLDSALPAYNFQNRPGEFQIYLLFKALFPSIDALVIGQFLSTTAYLLSAIAVAKIAEKLQFSSKQSALIAFGIAFSLSASASQPSSSNLAMVALLWGIYLSIPAGSILFKLYAVVFLGLAIFLRLDSVMFTWLVIPASILAIGVSKNALIRSASLLFLSTLLGFLFYLSVGIDPIRTLTGANPSQAELFSLGLMAQIIYVLSPFFGPLALLGVWNYTRREQKRPIAYSMFMTLTFAPFILTLLIYKTKIDTPRFLNIGLALMSLAVAAGIEYLRKLQISRIRKTMTFSAIALVICVSLINRIPFGISEGFRSIHASYLTPLEIFELKKFLHSTEHKVLLEIEAATLNKPSTDIQIVVTGWNQINYVHRNLLSLGAKILRYEKVTAGLTVGVIIPVWKMDESEIRVYPFEFTREFKTIDDAKTSIREFNKKGKTYLLSGFVPLSQADDYLCMSKSTQFLGQFNEYGYGYTTWTSFSKTC